jgi:hypothetical protein
MCREQEVNREGVNLFPMAFLKNIAEITNIEWEQNHLWDVMFDDSPAKEPKLPKEFKNWFPASEVRIPRLILESHTIDASISQIRLPKSTSSKVMSISFLDNIQHGIKEWLAEWVNSIILNNDLYLSLLSDIVKTVHVKELDRAKEEVNMRSYLVYPEGDLPFTGTSEAGVPVHSMNFVIVGGG